VTAPEAVRGLAAELLSRAEVAAVTLEYNWNGGFPVSVALDEVDRMRQLVGSR